MTPEEVLASLIELAKRTGIRVRFDEMPDSNGYGASAPTGGLCIVHGEPLVVLDVRSTAAQKAEIVASALSRFGVVPIYLPRARTRRFALRH